jgi:hypothetical protein
MLRRDDLKAALKGAAMTLLVIAVVWAFTGAAVLLAIAVWGFPSD